MITCNQHYEMLLWYLRNEVATLKKETVWDGLTLTKDLQTWLHILLLHMHSRVQLPELDKYTFIKTKWWTQKNQQQQQWFLCVVIPRLPSVLGVCVSVEFILFVHALDLCTLLATFLKWEKRLSCMWQYFLSASK